MKYFYTSMKVFVKGLTAGGMIGAVILILKDMWKDISECD